MRLGAPTHGEDQSQRYAPLSFSASGTTLTVSGPNNPNEAPAGHYMLFAVDAAGVPSVASIVEVQRTVATGTPPPPPPPVNLALGRPATGSTPCRSSEGPPKAVNGSVSGGLSDKFCSRSSNRYLRVDLGSNKTISSFVVKHTGAGGESSALNTRSYRIESRTSSGSWSTAATVTNNTASVTTTTIAPRSARYVRVTVTAAEQANARGAARIYEFEVYNGSAAAPVPPAPLVAYSGLDATGRAQRFEVGRYDAGRGNLGLVGHDATRSIDIAPGYRATICRDAGLLDCTTLGAGRHATLPAGFDLAISSLRVMPA